MTAKEYILSQLNALKAPFALDVKPTNNSEMVDAIFKFLFSKKFRKFSVPENNQAIIRAAIEKNIVNEEPIKISWPFGGYKLWSLEETPEVDWAELFSIIYFVRWLKPICALYPKGVIFTFWFDEVVISRLNNIPQSELDAYRKSFTDLLTFIKPWLPHNMQFESFLERSQYEKDDAFEVGLKVEMEKLAEVRAKNPQPLSDKARRSIEMNVKLNPEQTKDPEWREKVDLMHYAYYNLQEKQNRVRPSYTTENITAFTYFFEPNVIPIGTTKTSIAKFWVGVGALQRRQDTFIEIILTPSQIANTKYVWQSVGIKGLEGKNFAKIRVIS
jgi:hypothetical protein